MNIARDARKRSLRGQELALTEMQEFVEQQLQGVRSELEDIDSEMDAEADKRWNQRKLEASSGRNL